mmetsp:Transcript_49583/g.114928  ORF Transcript_49583/g.114928 Transcript_49583/m.114928 type:complete len:510 (+) Transcript_49583:85-1614(+)
MRGGHGCGAMGTLGMFALMFVGLYLTMEAWAVEKTQAETQINIARVEASKQISQLESQLRDVTAQRTQLQDELGGLRTQLAATRAELETRTSEAAQEKAKLLRDFGGLKSKQESEAASLRRQLAEKPRKGLTVQVEEVSWKDMGKVPVWVWWDFPRGVPTGYRLNMRTWMRHIPADKFDLRLVNFTNIKNYIPDLPDAFFRVYPLAQSDYVRAAMLALHGGVYMDGDMLLRNDLDVVFRELMDGTTQVIPYLWEHQRCRKDFSTNFIAGTRGNLLSKGWLERIYKLMALRCPAKLDVNDNGMFEFYKSAACCYLPSGEPRRQCYVTFGEFGDKSAHSVMAELDKHGKNEQLKMSCISKWDGMAANASGSGGELLWKKLLPGPPEGYTGPIGPWSKVPKKEQRAEMCWRDGPDDLRCTQSGLYPNFMKRHGYHLFNLNNNDLINGFRNEEELLDSGSVVAALYKMALEGEQPDPRMAAFHLVPSVVNEHQRANKKMWGDTQQYKMPWLRY